ncbi:MAG TPA: DegT/DnrJ/EryC1/StrS family aminotransferase [Tepidisphaeraceae bacterium]
MPAVQSTLAIKGGDAAARKDWPRWPVWDDRERSELLGVLESGDWWFGKKVQEFEKQFAAFHGVGFGVTCTNGTTAIEMGLRGLGILPGDEVIVPAYTFIATASAVITVGAIPIFADIDPETLCIDPQDVERKITARAGRTRAIIPVHVGGQFADMDRLVPLARKHHLGILEDAAHASGSMWQGEGGHGPGTLGDCATFSFQASKNITAGEGGILLTNNEELAELCRSFSHIGRTRGGQWYQHEYLGSNLRMTEFQAAILLAQLTRLKQQTLRRQASARILDEALRDVPGIHVLRPDSRMTKGGRRSYHMYIFRVEQERLGIPRDRFMEALLAEGVPASRGWWQPIYRNPLFQNVGAGPPHPIRSPLAPPPERGRGLYRRSLPG